ncbi:MAG: PH domain-containing protein [Anaerolineae bacterium]
MDNDASLIIRGELAANERLLWAGQPGRGIALGPSDIFLIPFTLLWFGFAVFWESTAVAGGAPVFFALWGIPFVLVGLYMVFGRFFVDSWQRSKMYYGVTSQRIIIVSGMFSKSVKSLNLRTLSDISMNQKGDGSGTITFGPTSFYGAWMRAWPTTGAYTSPSFAMIPDVKRVYDTIRTAQTQA